MLNDDSQQKGLRQFFRNKKYAIILMFITILLFIKFSSLSNTYSSPKTLLVVLGIFSFSYQSLYIFYLISTLYLSFLLLMLGGGLTAKGDVSLI
jgi:hypothetical protein